MKAIPCSRFSDPGKSPSDPAEKVPATVGHSSLGRREFLKRAALGCGALAVPEIIPGSALGLDGAVAPSERIVMGGIGMGGRGSYDLSILLQYPEVQFVAVCEVQKPRRDTAKRAVDARYGNQDCAVYRDMRDLLSQRPELDAVLIATGDRWHTPASLMAMKAGKDVFCEKPCTMSVVEGQVLVETARRLGRVFQAGMQRLSEANFVFCDELARSGKLGELHTVRAHILPWKMSPERLPAEPEPEREALDWDLWLGPAPWRPYNKGYLDGCGAWLDYYDFGTGVAGWGSHTICQCQSALGAKHSSAVDYEYGGNANGEGYTAKFANGVKLVLSASGWRGTCGIRYEGSEGWVSVADGYPKPDVSSPALLEEFDKVVRDYQARTQRPMNHIRDFLDSVRRRRPCIASEAVAHRTMTTNHVINLSILLRRNLKWDPEKEQCVNDPEANRMLSRSIRPPWHL
jgi:predicted dehydrogenase